MITPIYKAISDYISNDVSRCHMPGHKGNDIYHIGDLWQYDITEIDGLDNLLNSNGVIKQTENLYSKIYNSKFSVITTQGSTLGIQIMLTAALMSLKCKSKKIIIDRNAHISAINTMALLDIEPIWIYPDEYINKFMPGVISDKNIEEKLINNPDVNIVYITSPNYFGQIMNLKSIADICNKYNKLLLVDNAHGSHFKFISNNLHPMDCGCSGCCDSLHKTLPVLTGGGLVHVLDDRLVNNLKRAQRLYSSTSPSYLTMLSIDLLLTYINDNLKNDLYILSKKIIQLNIFARNIGFDIPCGNMDPIKFVVGSGMIDCSSKQMAVIFRKYKIEPEFVSDYWLLFMFSAQNREVDFTRIKDALKNISQVFSKKNKNIYTKSYIYKPVPLRQGLSIRQATFSKYKTVKTIDSLGEVVIEIITTCPPCVPIIMPGEIISYDIIEILLAHDINYLKVKC